MSQGLRYKFNGSTFAVQTGYLGVSPLPVITGVTQANPAVVSSGTTQTDGDVVKIAGVLGMTGLNNNLYVVDNAGVGSFELAGEDTTDADAYTSGGTIDEAAFSTFCELTGANQQDGGADTIDVTTICSTAKEF
jgi:Ubiquitin-activating enzyme E1 FCCH domain